MINVLLKIEGNLSSCAMKENASINEIGQALIQLEYLKRKLIKKSEDIMKETEFKDE